MEKMWIFFWAIDFGNFFLQYPEKKFSSVVEVWAHKQRVCSSSLGHCTLLFSEVSGLIWLSRSSVGHSSFFFYWSKLFFSLRFFKPYLQRCLNSIFWLKIKASLFWLRYFDTLYHWKKNESWTGIKSEFVRLRWVIKFCSEKCTLFIWL